MSGWFFWFWHEFCLNKSLSAQKTFKQKLEKGMVDQLKRWGLIKSKYCSLLFLFFMTLALGCAAKKVATVDDYQLSSQAFRKGNIAETLAALPVKEKGGFIHSFESAWLKFLAKEPDSKELLKVTKNLEDRKTFRYSEELKTLFYLEAEDHYFPGEHEVILAHIVNAYSFAVTGDRAKTRIEVQRASRYIQGHFNERAGDFDDPALRVMIGSLWAWLGEWDEAKVDFRRASNALPENDALKKLTSLNNPPQQLILALSGSGHKMQWDPEISTEVFSGLKQINFVSEDKPFDITIIDKNRNQIKKMSTHISTTGWYKRHQERNHAIKDILTNSQYVFDASVGSLAGGLFAASGVVLGISVFAVSLVGGYYALVGTNSGELAVAIIGLGVYGGKKIGEAGIGITEEIINKTANPIHSYRYVRFLPEHLYFDFDSDFRPLLELEAEGRATYPLYTLKTADPNRGSDIKIFYLDGKNASNYFWNKVNDQDLWFLGKTQKTPDDRPFDCGELDQNYVARVCRYPSAEELNISLNSGLAGRGPPSVVRALEKFTKVWLSSKDNRCSFYDMSFARIVDSPECLEEDVISLYIADKLPKNKDQS